MTYSLKSRPIRIAPVIPDIELDPDEFILLPEKEESLATPAIIGKSIPRKDGKAKVLGRKMRQFVAYSMRFLEHFPVSIHTSHTYG
jgi:hypothetical protein